jgi:DnaJ family protein C protein 1
LLGTLQVNGNFFELLGVTEDASTSDIRKAFRTKSMELHPDRNSAPDADNQFRLVADVANVLKDPELRKM